MRLIWQFLLPVFVLLVFCPRFAAAESCNPAVDDCVKAGQLKISVALGAGLQTNPLLEQDDIFFPVLFGIEYYGERIFFDNKALGYTLFENPRHIFNAVGTIGFDQRNFTGGSLFSITAPYESSRDKQSPPGDDRADSEAPEEPPLIFDDLNERKTTYYAGFEYNYYSNSWYLNFQALQAVKALGVIPGISQEHSGNEFRFAATYPWQYERHFIELSLGGLWQDKDVLGYYYGVSADEAPSVSYLYAPNAGVSPVARFDWKYYINRHWHVQFSFHRKWFSEEITNSPLVVEDVQNTLFFGGVYHF